MKRPLLMALLGLGTLLPLIFLLSSHAADNANSGIYEYATIRWGGRDNTHVIRPNGEVEFVGAQLRNFKRPDRADDRSFCMNIVMNGLAKDGWEVSAMTSDDIVMRRIRR
jgi:hypothetical protein